MLYLFDWRRPGTRLGSISNGHTGTWELPTHHHRLRARNPLHGPGQPHALRAVPAVDQRTEWGKANFILIAYLRR